MRKTLNEGRCRILKKGSTRWTYSWNSFFLMWSVFVNSSRSSPDRSEVVFWSLRPTTCGIPEPPRDRLGLETSAEMIPAAAWYPRLFTPPCAASLHNWESQAKTHSPLCCPRGHRLDLESAAPASILASSGPCQLIPVLKFVIMPVIV